MKQIYHFDSARPPALTEKMLRIEIERRRMLRQTALVALAGALINWCLFIAAFLLYTVNIFLSIACISYTFTAIYGAGAIAAVYVNRRNILWLSQ